MHKNNGESSYRRYLKGDKDAFDEIIELYRKGVTNFIFYRVGNIHIAEDISEDCFVELIVNPTRYKFKSSLKTYLYGIAHNKTKQYFRKNKAVSFVSIDDMNEIPSSDNTDDDIVRGEYKKMIHNALSELPQDYRQVIYLIYFEEMSYKNISKIMKKNVKQVYNLAFRGKNKLKNILEKGGFIYEEL